MVDAAKDEAEKPEPLSDEDNKSLDEQIEVKKAELSELEELRNGGAVHHWTPGQLPGAVKIRTCAGDENHASHWEKV